MSYNGYENYETWAVSLWLGSDRGSYESMNELAKSCLADEVAAGAPNKEIVRLATYKLAGVLRDLVEYESNPLIDEASLYSDLLGSALGMVSWHEVAEGLIEHAWECMKIDGELTEDY